MGRAAARSRSHSAFTKADACDLPDVDVSDDEGEEEEVSDKGTDEGEEQQEWEQV